MMQNCLIDWSAILYTSVACIFVLIGYYIYLDYQVKMLAKQPEKGNKITVKILAAGFTMAYAAMLLPTSKETLDFDVYSMQFRLYFIVRAVLFLGMLSFGLITGGTYLSNFKGKQ